MRRRPDPDFDPAGQRVAVIGADASAGPLIDRLASSAATVKVFPLPPRRVVRVPLRRPAPSASAPCRPRRPSRCRAVTSPIDEVTAAGIRTADGVHHDADAIVYGTGFAIRAGLPTTRWSAPAA